MGACWDQLRHAANILLIEANGVTDNPLIFGDDIISAGIFMPSLWLWLRITWPW